MSEEELKHLSFDDVLNTKNWTISKSQHKKTKNFLVYFTKDVNLKEIYFLNDNSFVFYGNCRIPPFGLTNFEKFNFYKDLFPGMDIYQNYLRRSGTPGIAFSQNLSFHFNSAEEAFDKLKKRLNEVRVFNVEDFPSFGEFK